MIRATDRWQGLHACHLGCWPFNPPVGSQWLRFYTVMLCVLGNDLKATTGLLSTKFIKQTTPDSKHTNVEETNPSQSRPLEVTTRSVQICSLRTLRHAKYLWTHSLCYKPMTKRSHPLGLQTSIRSTSSLTNHSVDLCHLKSNRRCHASTLWLKTFHSLSSYSKMSLTTRNNA